MLERIICKLVEEASSCEPVAGQRHAAAVVHRGRIISLETNSKKTHPIQKRWGKNRHSIYLHAEVNAIIKAMKTTVNFNECDLYVIRLDKMGNLAKSKPCRGCQDAIKHYNFKEVYHS